MRHTLVAALALSSACRFPELPPIETDAAPIDSAVDSAVVDATDDGALACTPNSITCEDEQNRYVECSSSGTVVREMECPLGCAKNAERCLDLNPSNGVAEYLDMAATRSDSISVTFTGSSTIFGDGQIAIEGAPQAVAFARLPDGTLVHMFRSLHVSAGATLRISGADPVIIVVDGPVEIDGLVSVFAGSGTSACPAPPVSSSAGPTPGAGGGGNASSGAPGGAAGNGSAGGTGGSASPDQDLTPLRGGCAGGDVTEGSITAIGGYGGGALQISSRTRISIRGFGAIDASGGGGGEAGFVGDVPTTPIGGPGGGAGGAILLEAPLVELRGNAVLSTKGGGGAAAGRGEAGWEGQRGGTTAAPAAGGFVTGQARGGNGAAPSGGSTAGGSGQSSVDDGGGGGGSGGWTRLHVHNSELAIEGTAQVLSDYTTAALGTRLVP